MLTTTCKESRESRTLPFPGWALLLLNTPLSGKRPGPRRLQAAGSGRWVLLHGREALRGLPPRLRWDSAGQRRSPPGQPLAQSVTKGDQVPQDTVDVIREEPKRDSPCFSSMGRCCVTSGRQLTSLGLLVCELSLTKLPRRCCEL